MVSPELIVIKRWTWKKFALLFAGSLFLLVLSALSGFFYGLDKAIDLSEKNQQLEQRVQYLSSQIEDAKRQLVMQEQISKVDKAANLHAGTSMDSQLQRIRELERELKFFRSIIAPEESEKGLQLARFNWKKSDTGQLNWQLSLIQAGSQGKSLAGVVTMTLVAMDGTEQVEIPIQNQDQKQNFSYRFKYFQHITGTISIEGDLVPIAVNVVARPAVKGQQPIEKQFPWQSDEEKLANVG